MTHKITPFETTISATWDNASFDILDFGENSIDFFIDDTHTQNITQPHSHTLLNNDKISQAKLKTAVLQQSAIDYKKSSKSNSIKNPKTLIPDSVAKSYIQMNGKFYFKKKPEILAFVDKGTKLHTKLNHKNIVSAMVDIAEARGWTQLRLQGSVDFRREAWLETTLRGLAANGYQPSNADLVHLKKMKQERTAHEIKPEIQPETTMPHHVTGANQSNNPPETHEDKSIQKNNSDHNNIEKAKLFINKSQSHTDLLTQYPDLINEVAILQLAEKYSTTLLPEIQGRFVDKVRENIAHHLEKGEATLDIYINEQSQSQDIEIDNER